VDAAAVAAFKGECHLLWAGADGFGDAADAAVDKVGPAICCFNRRAIVVLQPDSKIIVYRCVALEPASVADGGASNTGGSVLSLFSCLTDNCPPLHMMA